MLSTRLTCARTRTHLEELVGLLPVQPVGNTEGVRSVLLVKVTQQFSKTCMDVVLHIGRPQALWRERQQVPKLHRPISRLDYYNQVLVFVSTGAQLVYEIKSRKT